MREKHGFSAEIHRDSPRFFFARHRAAKELILLRSRLVLRLIRLLSHRLGVEVIHRVIGHLITSMYIFAQNKKRRDEAALNL